MANIPTWLARLGALALGLGCGGGGAVTPRAPGAPAPVPLPPDSRLDSVFVLESSGAQAEDTTVVVPGGQTRTIVIRRGAPDNSLFARLVVGAAPAERRLTIRPRPGAYGFDLGGDPGSDVQVTMSYALHFVAPAGARARYGGDLGFERALLIAQVRPDGVVSFLRTQRPGSDLLQATLPGAGRYLVAAPRR